MDIRAITDSSDVVLASNTTTNAPSNLNAGCEAGNTYKIITNSTGWGGLYSLKFTPETEGEFEQSFISGMKEGIPFRIKAPSDYTKTSYPLVIFLHGESRIGTDNSKQLFDCSDLFRQLEGQAILVAPQTDGTWNTDSLGLLIDDLKYEYHSVKASLAGGPAPASILPALSTVNEPFGKYKNSAVMNDKSGSTYDRRSGDMVSSVMKSYYDKSGVPIVGVQASRGGETTSYFMSDGIMSEITTRYKEAEEYLSSAGYTVRRKFMVWCQGCSDADEIIAEKRTLDTYRSNVEQIFDKVTEATGISDIFVVRIGHRNNNNSADEVTVKEAP